MLPPRSHTPAETQTTGNDGPATAPFPGTPTRPGPRTAPAGPSLRDSPHPHAQQVQQQTSAARAAPIRPRQGPVRGRAGRTAAAVLTALSTTGCWVTNPAATTMDYSPFDGIQEQLGAVELHNLLIVAPDAEEQGRVLGTVVNDGEQAVTLRMDAAGSSVDVAIPARGSVSLEDTAPMMLDRAGADPGQKVETTFEVDGQSLVTAVPVLDATLPYLAPYVLDARIAPAIPASTSPPPAEPGPPPETEP